MPTTWSIVRLGDIAEIHYGAALRADKRNSEGSFDVFSSGGIAGKHDSFLYKGPSIIIGRKGSVGEVYLSIKPFWCIDTAFYLKNISSHVDLDYLYFILRFINLSRLTIVVGVPGLNRKDLAAVDFPLPSFLEQQRIVAILKHAEASVEQRNTGIAKGEEIISQIFIEYFGDPSTNSKNWKVAPFGKYVTYSKYGPRFPDRKYSEHGARILRTTDMTGTGQIRWWDSPILPLTETELEQHVLKPRTLLVSRSGTIGPFAVFEGASEPCVAGAYLIEFGFSDDLHPEFVRNLFLTRHVQAQLQKAVRSATQPNINAPSIKAIQIPVPPLHIQEEFVSYLNVVKDIQGTISKSNDLLRTLKAELLLAAFCGDLTKRWREDNIEALQLQSGQDGRKFREGKPIIVRASILEQVRPYRELKIHEPERGWLIEQLSTFQHDVRRALYDWKGTLIADDPEMLDDFCRKWPVENDENLQDQIRRVLGQLASMGLIAKISIRTQDDEGKIRFLIGYRFLRDEERTQTSDVSRLEKLLMEAVE
jgi:type I restriction enzyme S subunit